MRVRIFIQIYTGKQCKQTAQKLNKSYINGYLSATYINSQSWHDTHLTQQIFRGVILANKLTASIIKHDETKKKSCFQNAQVQYIVSELFIYISQAFRTKTVFDKIIALFIR